MPVVITDYVPTGLVYVAGSAMADNTLPAGVGVVVRYTTNGTDWVVSEPVPASTVVGVQWWLTAPLDVSAQVTVRFQAVIPVTYVETYVKNCGAVSLGNNDPTCQRLRYDDTHQRREQHLGRSCRRRRQRRAFRQSRVLDTNDTQETGIAGVSG
jgi:hypothetical protein